jgi:hypothetical protein
MVMEKVYRSFLWLLLITAPALPSKAQKFDIDTLQYYGSTEHLINLVILGDGYTAEQLAKFTSDAGNFTNYLFAKAPFSAYKSYFNVFAIKVPSAESGVKHPRTAVGCPAPPDPVLNPDNYFGTTFDVNGIHRLVAPTNYNKIALVLANTLPAFDQVVLLANTTVYGGSGGLYATATLNTASNEIAVHELGHSFAGLADEYWAGESYAAEKANMTQENDPGRVRWKNWLSPETSIGIYAYPEKPWYKPAPGTCIMESLGKEFCAVCSEAIIENLHALLSPIGAFAPGSRVPIETSSQTPSFYVKVKSIKPSPNTLKSLWQLNGVPVAGNADSLLIVPPQLLQGRNNLSFSIIDTTNLTRSEAHVLSHRYTLSWQIDHAFPLPVTLSAFTATASAAGVTLIWTTATEINNDRFEVERSTNGLDWTTIGLVRGHGNSHIPQQYFFVDRSRAPETSPAIYYRLKQSDSNGHYEYSAIRAVAGKPQTTQVRLLGNPVTEQLHFEISGAVAAPVWLGIYTLDGSNVLEYPVMIDQQTRQVTVPVARLAPGIYIYTLLQDTDILDTGRFLKIKN